MKYKYDMEYWLHEIEAEKKILRRGHLLNIADKFLTRDERKLIREKLEEKEIEYKTRF